MKEIIGTLGRPVGKMEEFGLHTAMELHGRVYLNGDYMEEMTFEEACNVARYRFNTEPKIHTEVDVGRFSCAAAMLMVGLIILAASLAFRWIISGFI